ncbi:MAG: asparagine synthase (glutamine-hydrolyzing) [Candidatus Diapherotrites archaeon]
MCGIIGFNFEDRGLLKKGVQFLGRRGPDGSGTFSDKFCSLGHARLKILDLSDNAKQPMQNKVGNIAIVFNGEIYNFLELKKKLSEYHFRSTSDTEVILYLYEKFGENFVEMLQGIFAIAIYDARKKKIFLYRDPVGVKPLYYYFKEGKFVFASEIKAILACEDVPREVDSSAFKAFLQLRYIPWPLTIFKNIFKLPPGNWLEFSNGKISLKKFEYAGGQKFSPSDGLAESVRSRLEKAVKDQMISDVEVGAFLSGGIDSSIVSGLMSQAMEKNLKTFSIRFPNSQFDESRHAELVSKVFNTEHFSVDFDESAVKYLKDVVFALDEPLADPAALPTFVLSKFAKKRVSVVLTGEGGDELFGGYEHINIIKKFNPLFVLPKPIRKLAIFPAKLAPKQLLNKMLPYFGLLGEETFSRIELFLDSDDDVEKYLSMVEIVSEKEYGEMVPQGERFALSEFVRAHSAGQKVEQLLDFEFRNTLPENLLMKVDKTSMNFGLEARVPFLDLNFSNYVRSIPSNLLLAGGKEKALLRAAFKGFLPEEILQRKKQRFFVPIHEWFSKGVLDEEARFQELAREKWIRREYLEKAKRNFGQSPLYYARQYWNLLCFSMWKEQFLD